MRLITLSELLNALSYEFIEEHPDLPISRVRGLRNILAHAYGTIDFERMWKIIEEDYPALSSQLRQIATKRNIK